MLNTGNDFKLNDLNRCILLLEVNNWATSAETVQGYQLTANVIMKSK